MNSQLRSLENSPSFQIFQQNASMSPLIYDLDDSLIPMSRNKYELSFSSSTSLGGSASFDLLRVGLLNAVILKLRFTGFDATSVGHFGGGYNVIKEISILSHNKKLLRMNRNNIQQKIGQMPYHVRKQIESSSMMSGCVPNDVDDSKDTSEGTLAQVVGYFDTNSNKESTTYLYIPFSVFDDLRTACSWNMEFLENLTLQVDFEEKEALATNNSSIALDTTNSKVIVSYYDLRNSDMKKFEQANYKVDDNNLSLVLRDYYTETSPAVATLDGDDGALANRTHTFSIPIQCRSLITSIYVRVQNTSTQNGLEGVKVEEISLNLDGKEFIKYKAEELQLLTAVVGGVSVGNNLAQRLVQSGSEDVVDPHENYYELKFNVNQSNAFSSALSARSVGQPELKVKIYGSTRNSNTYKCFVECEHISLLSISSTDGKIQKSQNL